MQTPAIEAIGLKKNYGNFTALAGLNLSIGAGEIFAFLGPNGAGKTTTVKLFTGLVRPTAGIAKVMGTDVFKDPSSVRPFIGLVPDRPFIYEHLTGFEYMRFVGDVWKIPVNEQKSRIGQLLEMFELTDRTDELVEAYSHGMKQKLVLASVLLHKPKILFVDEPLVGLDPKSGRMVKEIFTELAHRGATIFMCTHVLEIAEKLAHRVAIIDKGALIAVDTVEGLKAKAVGSGLEDIFLSLTGGADYADLIKNL
jgi:ABC-2 type transport system ATP-binding protein